MPGVTLPPALAPVPVVSAASTALLDPPEGLPEPASTFWRAWAPHAIERGTLDQAAAIGFRELCERYAWRRALWDRLQTLGIASAEADRVLKRYEKASHLYDQSLARFKLTSFGKPIDGQAGKPEAPPVNPWASLVKQA